MVHSTEKLSVRETAVQELYSQTLDIPPRKTKKPVVIGMIGLVGSGKSTVARALAEKIGAAVVSGDDIRIELRKLNERFERTRAIAENVALKAIRAGGNAVIDSDFIDAAKRASLREKLKGVATTHFLCVYADLDVMIGRIAAAQYNADDFFTGAASAWHGEGASKGAVIKLRELIRRLPLHYRWNKKDGGQWEIRNPPCTVIGDIDTGAPQWERAVEACAKALLK